MEEMIEAIAQRLERLSEVTEDVWSHDPLRLARLLVALDDLLIEIFGETTVKRA